MKLNLQSQTVPLQSMEFAGVPAEAEAIGASLLAAVFPSAPCHCSAGPWASSCNEEEHLLHKAEGNIVLAGANNRNKFLPDLFTALCALCCSFLVSIVVCHQLKLLRVHSYLNLRSTLLSSDFCWVWLIVQDRLLLRSMLEFSASRIPVVQWDLKLELDM